MRAKSFIKTSVKVTERRIDEGTQNVHLEEHCTKIETTFHLFYALLFFANLVFKFNIVLIGIFFFIMLTTIYITNFEVPYAFIRNSKILMRLWALFLKVFSFKMLKLCSYFFMKNAYLVTAKITLDVKNCLYAA